jgi:DnaK suppressor protein
MEEDLQEDTSHVQRDRVLAAIERLESGTYGRCEVCGREIDDERLETRPETNRCREHA